MPTPASPAAQRNDGSFDDIWDEIVWRGLVHVSTDEAELKALLAGGPITYYCGFDPTAPSLHLGNLVQLLLLRRLQLAGHRPLGLVGGSTGLIGDPRPTAERTLNDKATVAEWVGYLEAQVRKFLAFDGENAARIVNNLDWTAPLSAIDFLRDVGKHYRVGTMLKKDAVAARLNSEAGISYTEFSYQILQGLDFLELYRHYGCILQTGGSDQWGNLTSGTDLIHRVEGVSAHAIGTPLITNSDGTKFGKSESGTVWLDAHRTSPYILYQFFLRTEDAVVGAHLRQLTLLPHDDILALDAETAGHPERRAAQRALARSVVGLVHGESEVAAAERAAGALYSEDIAGLDEATLLAVCAEAPASRWPRQDLDGGGLAVVDALVRAGLAASKGMARSTITQGGAYVNNRRVPADVGATVGRGDLLHDRYLVLRKGKRDYHLVEFT